MTSRKRRLIFSQFELGAPITARCSNCHRPFEIRERMALSEATKKITAMFDAHACREDISKLPSVSSKKLRRIRR